MNIQDTLSEVTLKEASILCRKSEKTLRRKIEAGLLEGRKEPLEFGGFMWVISIDSLEQLYPGSRPSQLPQLFVSAEPPQVRIKTHDATSLSHALDVVEQTSYTNSQVPATADEDDDEEEWNVRQSFFDYVLEENRELKIEIKARDAHILALHERTYVLERALGEQEGKAATQARVLEWFQTQEQERDRQRVEQERKLLEGSRPVEQPVRPNPSYLIALGSLAVTFLVLLVLSASGILSFHS